MSSFGFVGDLLIRKGLVDAAGLARAVESQAAKPASLARTSSNAPFGIRRPAEGAFATTVAALG